MSDYPIQFPTPEDEMSFKMQVEEWYEQHGEIYFTEIEDAIFVYRGITQAEFKKAMKLYKDDHEREEYVCRMCVLEPVIDDYSLEMYAGYPTILCGQILEESGFTNDPTKIKTLEWEAKKEIQEHPQIQVQLIIKEAFQDISFEEIEGWPIEKVMSYYAKALWLLEHLRGIKITSEEEEQKMELEMQARQMQQGR